MRKLGILILTLAISSFIFLGCSSDSNNTTEMNNSTNSISGDNTP